MSKGEPLRVLLVEDNPVDALLLEQTLAMLPSGRFALTKTERLRESAALLTEQVFDVVLLDLNLPDSSGLETLTRIRAIAGDTPVLVLTGAADDLIAIEAMRGGAEDYLVKGKADGYHIASAIRYAVERRRLTLELRSRERLLREAQHVAHLGSWEWDIATDLVTYSDELRDIYGGDPGELIENYRREFAAHGSCGNAASPLRHTSDIQIVRPDGSVRYLATRADVICDAADRPLRLTGVCQDVTERRAAQDSLRRSEEAYRGIVQASVDCVVTTDANGLITEFNPAAERTFGYQRDEILGRPLSTKLIPERYREPHAQAWRRYHQHGETRILGRRIEIEALRADGSEFPIELTVTRLGTDEPPVFSAFIRDLTERRLLEQQQRESEKRFRALIENSWDAIALTDAEGKVLYCSPAVTRALGYTPDELVGRKLLGLTHGDDQALMQSRLADALKQPRIGLQSSARMRHIDGSWRVIECVMTNLLDDPAVAAVVSNFRDVTERTRATEDLARIFDLSPDMICTAGFDGYFKKLNPAFQRTLGYSDEELRAAPFLSFVHASDQTRTVATAVQLSQGSNVAFFENRYRHKNGSYRWLQWSSTPDTEQEVIYAVCRDVTEQKEATAELANLRHQLELILSSIGDGVYRINLEGQITFVNPAAARMLGWEPDELLGKPSHATLHHSHPDHSGYPQEDCPIHATLQDRKSHAAADDVFWRKDGTLMPVEYTSSPLLDENEMLQGAVVTFRDITERQRNEEQLREREREYRQLFNGHPNPMWIYDVATLRFLQVNAAATKEYGYTREEFAAMTLREIRPPEDVAKLEQSLEPAMEDASPAGIWRHRRKSGEELLVEIFTAPITFQGEPHRLAIAVDVTERERLHQIAREMQASLARAQRVAHLGSWERDLTITAPDEEIILRWSDETFRIFGYEPGAFVPSVARFVEFVHADDREALLAAFKDCAATGKRLAMDHRITLPNGTVRIVHEEAEVIRDEQSGRATRAVGTIRDVTEQRRAQEALRSSEQRFRHLANAMPQMVWTATPDGALNYFNQRTFDYFAATHDDLAGWNWQNVLHPDDVPEAAATWTRSLETGQEYEIQFRLRRADGDFRWHLARAVAVRDEHGAVVQWFGTCTDVHDQVRVQEQLAEAQRVAHIGSWNRDVRTDTVTWSAELYRLFGLPEGAIADFASVAKLLHPADREHFVADARRVEQDGKPYTAIRRFVLKDGSTRMIQLNAEVEAGADGRPVRVYGTAQDITELHEAQSQVRKQASLLDLAHDAIVVRDKDDRIEYWNRGAERLYGWTAAEVLGRKSFELLYTDPERFFEAKEVLLANGEWNGERTHVTKSGKDVIVNSRWTLLRGENNDSGSTLVINTDITEQTKLQQQFLRAQRLESIGTLASGVAHDLNNILAPILMSAPLLRENASPQLTEKIINTIEESAERGAQIVKQVLTFARGVEGERVMIEPTHLLKEMVQIAEETFPKSIRISARYAEDVWPLEGDPTQLHQVLLNLSVNARDAMPNGGTLVLSVENFTVDEHYATMMPDAKPGPHVLISATDTGVGMPRAVIDKIFDPFFTTKEVGKGTGLGLSTMLGIVKSHGGFVSVYSEVGSGTTFKVFLPAAPTTAARPKAAAPAPMNSGKGETILVVDDEPGIATVTKLILEKHNYRVLTAADGPEALAVCAQHMGKLDAIITDLMMPFMDGVALIRAAQKMDPRIRFIASTGQGDQTRTSELQTLGVSTCLTKPYNVQKLLSSLHELLHR